MTKIKIIDSIYKKRRKKPKKKKEYDLRKPFEYAQFVKWIATPSVLREPSRQDDLAKEFRVHPGTLSEWKKRESFWDDVRAEMKFYFKTKTPNVLQAIYQKILKGDGSGGEAKIWLQYIDEWIPKQENINRDKTLEDLIKEDDEKNEQTIDRGSALDTKQEPGKSEIQTKLDPEPLREKQNEQGHNPEGQTEGI